MSAASLLTQALGQPTIISVVPSSGATAASPSAAVVFTFSEEMNTTLTSVMFIDTNGNTLTTTSAWSDNNTTLSCTPSPAFPTPDEIIWEATGESSTGSALGGIPDGLFYVGKSSSSGCTVHSNTLFTIDEGWVYAQTSAGLPALNATYPYTFSVEASLDSNLTATAVSVDLPNGNVSNLFTGGDTHLFITGTGTNNLSDLQAEWPSGNYSFDVKNTPLTDVTVDWNVTLQPNAPHIANYAAAQIVDSTKPFTLQWDAFTNKASTNLIEVSIGYSGCLGTGFESNLPGTATSVTIPAGVLQAGSNYPGSTLVFINGVSTTNTALQYVANVGRSSGTTFTLSTLGGTNVAPPSFTGVAWNGTDFLFGISGTPGTAITVQYSATLLSNSWTTLLTTNPASGTATITDTNSKSNPRRFYRISQ